MFPVPIVKFSEPTRFYNLLASNPEVKVVVLCGEGKNFCAGGDINYMKQMGQNSFQENKEDALQLAHLMHTLSSWI